MKQIGKQGKSMSPFGYMVVVVLIIVAGGLLLTGNFPGLSTTGTAKPVPSGVSGTAVAATAAQCNVQPSLTLAGSDALVPGTAATPTTSTYILAGVPYATAPALQPGVSVTVLGDLAGYLADVQTVSNVQCAAQPVTFKPYAYANATVTIKDDTVNSGNTLTNGGGATNSTAAAAGGTRNMPVYFQGVAQKSTGKIFWVVESPASASTNVSIVGAQCGGIPLAPVAIPAGVTASNAASYRAAFEVPAVVNGALTTCNLQIVNSATGTVKGTWLNTFYAEQAFVDSTGAIQTGIYDSTPNGNNAAKYQDKYTYNFVFQ